MEAPRPCRAALRSDLKYAELQQLAKRCGIKANKKAEKLVKELEEYFANSVPAEEKEDSDDDAAAVEVEEPKRKRSNHSAEQEDCCVPDQVEQATYMEQDAGGMEPDKLEQEDDSIKLTDEVLQPCDLELTNSMNECAPQQQAEDADVDVHAESCGQNDAVVEVRKEATPGLAQSEGSELSRGCEKEEEHQGQGALALQESEDTVDMRELVMAELETRLKNRAPTDPTSAKRAPLWCKTPREGAAPQAKNTTPGTGGTDWSKIHATHFGKMESLNDYVERKRKRREAMAYSAKVIKMTRNGLFSPDKVLLTGATDKDKKSRIPKRNMALPGASKPLTTLNTTASGSSSLANAAVRKTVEGSGVTAASRSAVRAASSRKSMPKSAERRSPRLQLLMAQKEAKSRPTVFKPVTSTSKMNVRFTEAPGGRRSNPPRSSVKTPKHAALSIARESSSPAVRQHPTASAQLDKSSVAPFRFDGISSPAGAKRKSAFNLQASLGKPLSYKPHKGKLKPWNAGDAKENGTTSLPDRAGYKQPKLQTRDDRRKKFEEERKNRKEQACNARRGFAVK
ncbi:nucleolar and spindle-associated protein 1 isoform X1 [Lethenteron reissneri]|uniref:nucleolar and spindle-associated protein 1 isoform X1 n=1 Tax=Lethenteron reissneri TaxID=7753 RepID=UPI002AB6E1D1|nr:nucleolar and spindle-associated protein 1 isoform X1 [Lethenteron reissneri]